MKTGRNEKCPCGSGKKYKKCHMGSIIPPAGVVQHLYDFGSQDPFCARMMFQIFKLRDEILIVEEEREQFDVLYGPILQNLTEARFVKDRAIALINEHESKVVSRKIATYDGRTITVDEFIGTDLNIWFKDFFVRGRIATERIKYLAKLFGYNLSFVFSDEEKFSVEKEKLLRKRGDATTKYLLDLIEDHRNQWYKPFTKTRTAIEHQGFKLPEIKYSIASDGRTPQVCFPIIDGMNIPSLLEFLWGNLFLLCEDTVVLMLASKVKAPMAVRRIPESQRDPDMPIRYMIDLMPTEGIRPITYKETRGK